MEKHNILAVDDERDNLELLNRTLRRTYNVTLANNAFEALDLLEQGNKFDMIITDQKMPGMEGVELLKKLNEDERYSKIIRILITAYSDIPLLIDAINTGKIFRYIKKPWMPEEVLNIIEKAFEATKLANDNQRLIDDFKDLFSGTLTAITEALDAKDSHTSGRSKRVCFYSLEIAKALDLSLLELSKIEVAGLLHDIGMIGVSEAIINKPSVLDNEEYNQVKKHVEYGVKILKDIKQLSAVVDIIKNHHEKVDGTGYPNGLKGDEIPVGARIIAIADAFDSMTSSRPYRQSLGKYEALKVIQEQAGKQFDSHLVDVFAQVLEHIDFDEQ